MRRWHGLLWNMNYMYSRQVDDTGAIRSAYRPEADESVSVNDQPHIFNSTFVYQVPLGKDHKLGGGSALGRALLSGWEISGITQFSSGRPFSILAAMDEKAPRRITSFEDQLMFDFAVSNDGGTLAVVRGPRVRDAQLITGFDTAPATERQ